MNDAQIALVLASFPRIFAAKGELAERFYVHLFDCLPEVRSLFRGEFLVQKEMFARHVDLDHARPVRCTQV